VIGLREKERKVKQIKLKKNLTSGIIGALFGVIMLVAIPLCIKAKISLVSSGIGPDYLPRLVAMLMIACGLGLVFQSLFLKKDEEVVITFRQEGHALLFAAAMIVYVILLPVIGFVLSSVLFAFASLFLMECKKPLYYLSTALLVLGIFVAFKYGLSVALPTLIL